MTHKRRICGSSWSSSFAIGILLGAQASVACTSADGMRDRGENDRVAGTVQLALTTGGAQRFRLSAAEFAVQDAGGAVLLMLDSEADPDSEALEGELPQGSYAISLAPGWILDRRAKTVSSSKFRRRFCRVIRVRFTSSMARRPSSSTRSPPMRVSSSWVEAR
jgi:hypothetical protein